MNSSDQQLGLEPGSHLGHYVIVEKIAEGGLGTVYKALEPALERYVAIKVLRASPQESNADLEEEARSVAALRHANIVPLYFIGKEKGVSYFAMAFIDGPTLADWLDQQTKFDAQWALWFMTQAVAALDYASRLNIIHLDVKPSNFIVDRDNIVMLTDFGLARKVQSGDSREVLGTPRYAAPEQIQQLELDMRTDIYSLGATLFHLMTGDYVFDGPTNADVCLAQVQSPFPVEKALQAGLSQGWTSLIHKMMEKKPADRFQNYGEISAALSDIKHFRYGSQLINLPGVARKRAIPRQEKLTESLYGIIPLNFAASELDKFEITETSTAEKTEEIFQRRFPLLALNVIKEDVETLCHPADGNLVDLIKAMEKLPLFRATVKEMIGFIQQFTERKIESEADEIEILGLTRSRNLALISLMLKKEWHSTRPLDWQNLWSHQIACGILLETMFDMLGFDAGGIEFSIGLFHDIGKIILSELNPSTYVGVLLKAVQNDLPLAQVEKEVFGFDHAEMGGLWFRKHKLDKFIADVIYHHEKPIGENDGNLDEQRHLALPFIGGKGKIRNHALMSNALHSVNYLVKELGIGFSGDTYLEQLSWSELPSTQFLWESRKNTDLTWEDFLTFFSVGCKEFPKLSLSKEAALPVKAKPPAKLTL